MRKKIDKVKLYEYNIKGLLMSLKWISLYMGFTQLKAIDYFCENEPLSRFSVFWKDLKSVGDKPFDYLFKHIDQIWISGHFMEKNINGDDVDKNFVLFQFYCDAISALISSITYNYHD